MLFQHSSLASRIAASFAALFLVAGGGLFWLWFMGLPSAGIVGERDQRMAQAMRSLEARADLQRGLFVEGIKERRGDVMIVAENTVLAKQVESSDPAAQLTLLRLFDRWQRAYPDRFVGLSVVEPLSGRVLASSEPKDLGQVFAAPELLQRASQAGASELIVQLPAPLRGVAIVRQIRSVDQEGYVSGRLAGVLIATVALQQFVGAEFDEQLAGAGAPIQRLLFDSAGLLLAQSGSLWQGPPLDSGVLAPVLRSGFEGTMVQTSPQGEEILVVYRPVQLSAAQAWTLVHMSPKREALAGLSEKAQSLAWVFFLMGATALLLIRWLAYGLTRPLKSLVGAVDQLGAGDHAVRAPIGGGQSREVLGLSLAFNGMAQAMQKAHQDLEKQVQARTAELQRSEARHRTLFEANADAVMVLDREKVIDSNPAASLLFGVASRDELLGRHPAELSPPAQSNGATSRSEAKRLIEIALQQGSHRFEWLHQRLDDGSTFVAEVRLSRVEIEGQVLMQAVVRDVSARKAAEEQLRLSEENLAITLQSIGDAVIATDPQGVITRMNTAAERLTGWPLADALGRDFSEVFRIVNAQTREPSVSPVQRVIEHGEVVGLANHTALLSRSGEEFQIADSAAPIRDSQGVIVGVVLVFSDVSEDYRMREALGRAVRLLARTGELAKVGGWEIDALTQQMTWSDEVFKITEFNLPSAPSLSEALGLIGADARPIAMEAVQACFEHGQVFDLELPLTTLSGKQKWIRAQGFAERENGVTSKLVGTFQDITERRFNQDQIKSLAFYDPLTNLPNRRLLMDRLEKAQAMALRRGSLGALLFVDLDNFKTLNDTLGHERGDQLLVQIAQRLNTCVRESDSVARLGGDEFVVMLEELSVDPIEALAQANVVGRKILDVLSDSYHLTGNAHHSTPSIGVTLFGERHEAIDEPLKRADLAMYQAKAAGKNTLRAFDPKMQAVVSARAAMESGLREGLAQGQFLLHYQAQVTQHQPGAPDRIIGAEVLLRWLHPQLGMVSPAEFIAVAEDSGLILPLGEWVLQTACRQLATWASQPEFAELTLAVNVSAKQFLQDGFVERVLAALYDSGARPQCLKLELTEGVLISNAETVSNKMHALKDAGVGFSLDDFGTGYSSLAYLKRLPLDQLKIDQGFVRDILLDPNDAAIARMVVMLAETLGLEVIAEGVETEAQRDFLRSQGCPSYQGYLFSRPVALAAFEQLLRSKRL
ncbi:EAL domain-containing protein [Roseateles albus]|uniref:EAL domain-containing protein n=1 Tax=Roseateles albus TaxID=2987525 RepID=A0ABT5KAK9_9BURK|nr:EAL domain-containing protein [Roseateles albus]MDC8770599.1 EAL domain-containing protein [Roseateles albus]